MSDFDRSIVIGVVFDLANQHHEGKRCIDIVKDNLIQFATKLGLNCGIFVGHPNNDRMPRRQGESVGAIARYEEITPFNIENTMKQVLGMIAHQEQDVEKYIVLLSNRYKTKFKYNYEKVLMLNQVKAYNCKFIFIDLGSNTLVDFAEQCQVLHVTNPHQLNEIMTQNIMGDE